MPIFKNLYKWLRSQDVFGHPVTLNFNKKGDAHQTGCGGFFSLIMNVTLLVYLASNTIGLF